MAQTQWYNPTQRRRSDVDLPLELRTVIDTELAQVPSKRLATLSADLSERYRAGRSQAGRAFLRSADDIAAYAAFRLPATFAAVKATLAEIRDQLPHWSPMSLLDVGAGPGTAMWAATEVWPDLSSVTSLEREEGMISLGRRLAAYSLEASVREAKWIKADITGAWDVPAHDLVIAAYVLGELQEPAIQALVSRMWEATSGVLVLIEPGTMAGFARIKQAREQVLLLGAKTIAPCPHDDECPIAGTDWCHFSQRVARSRLHRQVKAGELAYEDEKFSYVALSRMPAEPIQGRVLRHPQIGKGHIRVELCTPTGLKSTVVTRKDKGTFRKARDLDWGSAVR